MATSNTTESYLRDIVARVTHDDPQRADAAIELLVLTDCSTPLGAAAHLKVLNLLYDHTDDHEQAKVRHLEEIREKLEAIQVSGSQ